MFYNLAPCSSILVQIPGFIMRSKKNFPLISKNQIHLCVKQYYGLMNKYLGRSKKIKIMEMEIIIPATLLFQYFCTKDFKISKNLTKSYNNGMIKALTTGKQIFEIT